MSGNILILSKDSVFARMLELELKTMRFSVAVNASPTERHNRLILVDLDSAAIPSKTWEGTRIIGFTRRFEVSGLDARRRCSMILHRPFQMHILREEVAHLSAAVDEREESKIQQNAPTLKLSGNVLTCGEAELTLRPKEVAVISYLLENRGKPVSREELATRIGESTANKADVYVCYLRRKLATATALPLIKTVRGKGYKID